jgi:T5SS/PEP-CTERM-associated repeat protein
MLAALMLVCIVPALSAQIVADGATSTLSNVTNTFTGDVTVGTNGSFTLLILSDNSLLTNSAQGVIGRNATARSNEVRLVSASARWHLGGSLQLGINGAANRLTVTNGGVVRANVGDVGILATSSNNVAMVTGSGSLWSNANELVMGFGSAGNQLVISNGGVVRNTVGYVGNDTSSSNNLAVVTDPGSLWTNGSTLNIGFSGGSGNQLRVSNGGRVVNTDGFLGFSALSRSNIALVTGVGSIWSNQNNLIVGNSGSGNMLIVSNGAAVLASNLFLGLNGSATNNRAIVDGGTLRVTNASGTGVLDVRRGTIVLNGGLIEVDILRMTNSQGFFELFNGGTLSAKNSRFGNGLQFHVGDGVSPATFLLAGNGTHDFSGTLGTMAVSSNAVLMGNGTLISGLISGVNVRNGGTVSPGTPIGKMTFSTSPSLAGTVLMELSKNGAALTNDQIQVTGKLTYDGTLIVTNLGPSALAASDRFPLFAAGSYAGAFGSITLPPLDPGLGWSNRLLVDGSIEVFDGTPSVTTLRASALGQTTATLNGMANPKGADSSAWFEFGFTTNYGNVTPPQPLGNGNLDTNFSQALTGLPATASYHFRAVASNSFGVMFGADRSFFTIGLRAVQLTDGQIELAVGGTTNFACLMEASTNLIDWKLIAVLHASNAPAVFQDPETSRFDHRFYRARLFPAYRQELFDFNGIPVGTHRALFNEPRFSGSTDEFLTIDPNVCDITDSLPSGGPATKVLFVQWAFTNNVVNPWLRLTTLNANVYPNPILEFSKGLCFDIYSDHELYVVIGLRETQIPGEVGSDGGTTGPIEWVGGTVNNSVSPPLGRWVTAGKWQRLCFYFPAEPVRAFTGNGFLDSAFGRGVFEHLAFVPVNYQPLVTNNVYLGNFQTLEPIP